MSNEKIVTVSALETQKEGQNLARQILAAGPWQKALILALIGELGAGKTTFLQGFSMGLGIEEVVNSPTFVILKRFKIQGVRFKNFYHIDCYRLEDAEEILDLGFREVIANSENIVAIEWPQKISSLLPKDAIKIVFAHDTVNQRSLNIEKNEL